MLYANGIESTKAWSFLCIANFSFYQSEVLLELVSLTAKFSCPELIQPLVKLYLSADDLAWAPHLYLNLL